MVTNGQYESQAMGLILVSSDTIRMSIMPEAGMLTENSETIKNELDLLLWLGRSRGTGA
jgi:hypothetical protein